MTIINRTYRFIFVHIPKTGGTSLKEHLRIYCSPGDIHTDRALDQDTAAFATDARIKKHSSAVQVRDALGSAEFERFYKFCVVRNPFVRTLSLFRFLKFNFRDWPRSAMMDEINTLEEFVASPLFRRRGPGGIVEPQIRWLSDSSGASYMDYIARVETIEDDFRVIKARLGLPLSGRPLLKRNVSKGDAISLAAELDSARVVDAIRTRYASDFRLLGYSTEPGEAILKLFVPASSSAQSLF
jgi:hypothetical protein